MKKEWPISEAMEVAESFIEGLRDSCERIYIVGSVRRSKPIVHDVELLFIPRIVERDDPADMFNRLSVSLADERIAEMEKDDILEKRPAIDDASNQNRKPRRGRSHQTRQFL